MMTADCQAKYFAYELSRRFAPDSAERMAGAVAGAQVDLNPHQVDAALFAFASPLSKGALLADESGWENREGRREEAHDLFDAHLPLVRYEQQQGVGLATRKYVMMKRGILPRPAPRLCGAFFTR
jgi:hypothetical protein